MSFKIAAKVSQPSPEALFRPSMGMDGNGIVYMAGDTNDNAVYVAAFDVVTGTALWCELLDQASNSLSVSPKCSRCYLPRVAALPQGGALISWKHGVKELCKTTADFNKSEWGLMVARIDNGGIVQWKKRYTIHKGNGQAVLDPFAPASFQLIATDGIRWEIATATGNVVRKLSQIFPTKSSGEKIYSWVAPRPGKPGVIHSITSGWSGCPSMYWNSTLTKAVPWANYVAYKDMGGDLTYVAGASPSGRPAAAVILAPYNGYLQENEWRPKSADMLYPTASLRTSGIIHSQDRFGPQCCSDPTLKNSVLAIINHRLIRFKDGMCLDELESGGFMTLCPGRTGQALVGQTNGRTVIVYRVVVE